MPEGIGFPTQSVSVHPAEVSQGQQRAEKIEQLSARKNKVVAEIVQQQADFSANQAEKLAQQAERAREPADVGQARDGVGLRLDISV